MSTPTSDKRCKSERLHTGHAGRRLTTEGLAQPHLSSQPSPPLQGCPDRGYFSQMIWIAGGAARDPCPEPSPYVRAASGGIKNGSSCQERNPTVRKTSS